MQLCKLTHNTYKQKSHNSSENGNMTTGNSSDIVTDIQKTTTNNKTVTQQLINVSTIRNVVLQR